MQKVEGSNPFSRFAVDRRLLGAGLFIRPPLLVKKSGLAPEARRPVSIYGALEQLRPALVEFEAPGGVGHGSKRCY